MKNKILCIAKIICTLSILQLSMYGLKQLAFLFIERTNFSDHMASMVSMIILLVIILIFSKVRNLELSLFPEKFSIRYIVYSVIFLALAILNPLNFSGNIKIIFILIYSSIVTPFYEEIIFRGIIWNKLEEFWSSKISVYLINAVLFGLWHIGYIDSIAFRVTDNLMTIMFWKVITGLAFGLVLGLVRLKTKNCYSTILTHGIMNIFAR